MVDKNRGLRRPRSQGQLLVLRDVTGTYCLVRRASLGRRFTPLKSTPRGTRLSRVRSSDAVVMSRLRRAYAKLRGDPPVVGRMDDREVLAGLEAAIARGQLVLIRQPSFPAPGAVNAASLLREGSTLPIPVAPEIRPGSPIAAWPLQRRFEDVLRRAQPKLPAEMRGEFAALIAPEAIAITAGILALWAASHAIGIGEIIDVVLLVVGLVALGWGVFEAASALFDFIEATTGARSEQDLERAATHLANAIALLGVAAFMALLRRVGARRRAGGGGSAGSGSSPRQRPSGKSEQSGSSGGIPRRQAGPRTSHSLKSESNAFTQRHVPKRGSLSNRDARRHYLENEEKLARLNEQWKAEGIPPKTRAEALSGMRNELRTEARDLMKDREMAEYLNRNEPNKTLDELVAKYRERGKSGDDLWEAIADGASRSRPSVNKKLGLE